MFCVSLKVFSNRIVKTSLFVLAFMLLAGGSFSSVGQRARGTTEEPIFSEFKGVKIGMPAEEARKKLGSPRDKSDEQDFYIFNDTQAVQVFYDKSKMVSAVSIDFMSGASDIPAAKAVLGAEADSRPDGSLYKMIRYPKAGYWVSYSKTAGSSPTITITMQKIEH